MERTTPWVTDGTASGTHELTGIAGANPNGVYYGAAPDLTVFDGVALFEGIDSANHDGLWVTDGAAAGTHELTGVAGANSNGVL